MNKIDRRFILKAGLGVATAPMLGAVASCSRPAAKLPVEPISDRISVITGAPGNVLVLDTGADMVLVDSGSVERAPGVQASLEGARVQTVFNTHYHADQTGGNVLFGEEGATIRSHEVTRQWLAADYYVPAEDRWVSALPEAGQPQETFWEAARELTIGPESIQYGYLLEAHTRGDIYVLFRDSNVLATGDVVSPLVDPSLDWYSGAWLGGRVDAMDDLLAVANDNTLIVPAYGPVMSKAELQAERDMMMHLYDRCSNLTVQGHSAQDMLNVGVMDEIERDFQDPYQFLYDVAKGMWAHYTNFGGQTV